MDLYEEIAKVARELYEKSGRIEGRDEENWLEAERLVKERLAASEKKKPAKAPGARAVKTTAAPGKTTAKKTVTKIAKPKKAK